MALFNRTLPKEETALFARQISLVADSDVPMQQGLALNRVVITRVSDALKKLSGPDSGLVAVPAADAPALADAIQACARRLGEGWAPHPRAVYEANFSSAIVRRDLEGAISG